MQKIKFVVEGVRWFDKVNGNTYFSCRITRTKDRAVLLCPFQYGYGDQYQYAALKKMAEEKWIPGTYKEFPREWESDNDYPILWIVRPGSKMDAVANGKE